MRSNQSPAAKPETAGLGEGTGAHGLPESGGWGGWWLKAVRETEVPLCCPLQRSACLWGRALSSYNNTERLIGLSGRALTAPLPPRDPPGPAQTQCKRPTAQRNQNPPSGNQERERRAGLLNS